VTIYTAFDDIPRGEWEIITADVPWKFVKRGKATKGDRSPKYKVMPLAEIKALPVAALAAKDCSLFFWTSGPYLKQAFAILDAWGFRYSTVVFTWVKLRPGQGDQQFMTEGDMAMITGYTSRKNTEIVLLAKRGHPKRFHADVRELIFAEQREHSRKPDQFFPRVERLAGLLPRIELFSREERPGWSQFGDEVDRFPTLAPQTSPLAPRSLLFSSAQPDFQVDDSGEDDLEIPAFLRRLANT
jgi:N6-adenosine-specific RNA methylase IME4